MSRFVSVGAMPWQQTKFPGVEVKILLLEKSTGLLTALLKMAPGAKLPDHEHVMIEQDSICCRAGWMTATANAVRAIMSGVPRAVGIEVWTSLTAS